MKRLLKQPIALGIGFLAHMIVRKYKPTVIMITGSVGKTSTKDALKAALSERSFVRASEKSYNSEFGVPLTIIGSKNPWTNPFSWLRVFKEAVALLAFPNHYPKILILEVGADRPGDLAKILRIALPDVVVVTRLPDVPVHVEAYTTPEAVREEEFVPAYGLAPNAPLIVNAEDTYALAYAKRLPITLVTFGCKKNATIQVTEPRVWEEAGVPQGMIAEVCSGGESYTLMVRGALGRQQLLAPAAALAVAQALGVPLNDARKGLESYTPPPGRARLFSGKENSIIIDDSYNASPAAVEEALHSLSLVPATRRIAVLGDMMELGRYSVTEHERIGKLAATCVDVVVAVGIRARAIAAAAQKAGRDTTTVVTCDTAQNAAEVVSTLVQAGDVVLVKGSQSIRTERVVEALLADPADAEKLVRQEKEWKRR